MIWISNYYKILLADKPDFVRGINKLWAILTATGRIFNMITSFDPEYQITKEVKEGKRKLSEIYQRLLDWINDKYCVEAINVYYDKIIPDDRPRIQVIFENHQDISKFSKKGIGPYFPEMQKDIATKFVELVSELDLRETYLTDNLFVCYSEFSHIYNSEISNSIPREHLKNLFEKYTSGIVWQIQIYGTGLIVFFYNNKEKKNPNNDSMIESLKNDYLALLKPFDKLGYLKSTWIKRESKEDFERIYKGNWYHWARDH